MLQTIRLSMGVRMFASLYLTYVVDIYSTLGQFDVKCLWTFNVKVALKVAWPTFLKGKDALWCLHTSFREPLWAPCLYIVENLFFIGHKKLGVFTHEVWKWKETCSEKAAPSSIVDFLVVVCKCHEFERLQGGERYSIAKLVWTIFKRDNG